jgi:hypothetical protein
MRSSNDRLTRPWSRVLVITLAFATLSAGCSRGARPSGSAAVACAGEDDGAGEGRTAAELRKAVESGPLFAELNASSPLASCRLTTEAGRSILEHTFANGASLRSTSDPRIEYAEQEARFPAARPVADAIALLKRVEATAFSGGCGIDWNRPDTANQADANARETVYRGATCNCRARVSLRVDGQASGVSLRSAC